MIISMETINKQEYIEYLQNLLVASYTMKPTPFRSMEDGLEEIATNRGQDKNQARADVRQKSSDEFSEKDCGGKIPEFSNG